MAGYAAHVAQEVSTPECVEAAIRSPESDSWQAAMTSTSLEENKVFRVVTRPPGVKVVKFKWVFRVKKNASGKVEKFKARVVSKEFSCCCCYCCTSVGGSSLSGATRAGVMEMMRPHAWEGGGRGREPSISS